ncbi:D-2-hydroxyacid dehydrogenase [Brumicola pallidula]|nr:D-2-hydroxyacid dehydrogenase [Glaciecola pallidula]
MKSYIESTSLIILRCDIKVIGIIAIFFNVNFIKFGLFWMPKIAIISRDYSAYKSALDDLQLSGELHDVELIWANEHANGAPLRDIEYALANPNIMSRYINECPNLTWLQSTWAGVNTLVNKSKRDYQLTGLKNVFGAQMREYVIAYLLYFQRHIPELITNQQQCQWQQYRIPTLQNQTMGIMGLGSIGKDVAIAAKAFGMKVYSLNATSKPAEADQHFNLAQLYEFASKVDVIVNLLPHTNQTTGICDVTFFETMRSHAIFINAGRANVINNDNDLVNALNSRSIRGAVIDVFKTEPLPAEHPFWNTPNLLMTNHTAATSQHELVFEVFKNNLRKKLQGLPLDSCINFEQGY